MSCSHCNDFYHNWCECPLLYKQALVQRQRLIDASLNPNRKMAGVSSLIHTLSKPMLKRIAAMFGLNNRVSSFYSGGEYRTFPEFHRLKTIRQFRKCLLLKLMDIHKKSVARPIIHLTQNPSPDPANEECPICFTRDADVFTNCHHSFCGECIITHSQSHGKNGRDCPMCRQTINTLLYDNKQTFPHNTCRNVNQKLGHFRFQQTPFKSDWDTLKMVIPEKNVNHEQNENTGEVFEFHINNILSFWIGKKIRFSSIKEPEVEKTLHQQCYELRQQGIYVRRNGFRFRRGDFVI